MKPGRRDVLILGGVAAGAAAIGAIAGAFMLQAGSGAADLLAHPFSDLSGQTRRLVEWRGKALACNFWATWCAPCREEMPLLDAAQQQYAAQGLQVVGIAIDNTANVQQFVAKVPVGYPILIADANAIDLMRELGNSRGGLPFTVLLTRAGRLAERKLGAYSKADLDRGIMSLLQ
jgi:thiol-disulfide isomerase/thioredoxin